MRPQERQTNNRLASDSIYKTLIGYGWRTHFLRQRRTLSIPTICEVCREHHRGICLRILKDIHAKLKFHLSYIFRCRARDRKHVISIQGDSARKYGRVSRPFHISNVETVYELSYWLIFHLNIECGWGRSPALLSTQTVMIDLSADRYVNGLVS